MPHIQKKKTKNTRKQAAADPQTVPPTPEQVVERIRIIRTEIAEVTPLTAKQRRLIRQQTDLPEAIVLSSINIIGASDNVTQCIGQPAGEVRQMVDEANRWNAVEDELRATLNGVAGANLVRRQKIALVAAQAYAIGKQLVRDPEHAALVPHVAEVKRLRGLMIRGKRTAPAPETPQPAELSNTQTA